MQTVKERVQEILDNANLADGVNKEAELWNILYNLSSDLNVSATDVYDTENEDLVGQINAYSAMYFNNFPKKKWTESEEGESSKETQKTILSQVVFYGLGVLGVVTGALISSLFFN